MKKYHQIVCITAKVFKALLLLSLPKNGLFAGFLSMYEFKPYEGPVGVRNYPTPRIVPTEYFGFGRPRAVALSFHGAPSQFKD